jgi:predicted TIM-barrel fold metal-dependent hydrolase
VRIDCHVHIAACTPGHGSMSPRLLNSIPFRFMRWRMGLVGADERTERALAQHLARLIHETTDLDAAVILAFDAVYDVNGARDEARTHLYVTNDYVMELTSAASAGPARRMLVGASVHPYRMDALDELDRCIRGGAVLMKWLPVSQGMDPSHPKCIPFYEAMAHHKLPLLCHTGGELSLPRLDDKLADPLLLEEALKRGVTVIMAHCATRSSPTNRDYLPQFLRLARQYENCYGDTSALNLPSRWYAYERVLADRVVREKLVHGSDWPIIAIPPVGQIDVGTSIRLLRDPNWLRRDVRIKQQLDFDDAYWHRAGKVLRRAN